MQIFICDNLKKYDKPFLGLYNRVLQEIQFVRDELNLYQFVIESINKHLTPHYVTDNMTTEK